MKVAFLLLSLVALSLSQALDFDSGSSRDPGSAYWLAEGMWTADVSGRDDLNGSVIEFSLNQIYSGWPCYYSVWVDGVKVTKGNYNSAGGSVIALVTGTVRSYNSELKIQTSNCYLGRYAVPFLFDDPNGDYTTPAGGATDSVWLVDTTPVAVLDQGYAFYYSEFKFLQAALPNSYGTVNEAFYEIVSEADGSCAFNWQACDGSSQPEAQTYYTGEADHDIFVDFSQTNPSGNIVIELSGWTTTNVELYIYYCNRTAFSCQDANSGQFDNSGFYDLYIYWQFSASHNSYYSGGGYGRSAAGQDTNKFFRYHYTPISGGDYSEVIDIESYSVVTWFPYAKVWDLDVNDDSLHMLMRLSDSDQKDCGSTWAGGSSGEVNCGRSCWGWPLWGESWEYWTQNEWGQATLTSYNEAASQDRANTIRQDYWFCPVVTSGLWSNTLLCSASQGGFNGENSNQVQTDSFSVSSGFEQGFGLHYGFDNGIPVMPCNDGAGNTQEYPALNLLSWYNIIVDLTVAGSLAQHVALHPTENNTVKGMGHVTGFHFGTNLSAGVTVALQSHEGYSMQFWPFLEFHALPSPVCTDPAVDCNGNGVCTSLVSSGCTCDYENALYWGPDCGTLTPYCETGTCANGGTCMENDGRQYDDALEIVVNATWCDCSTTSGAITTHNFEGNWCERIPPCESTPCLNGGVCMAGPGDNTYTCDCSGTSSQYSKDPFTGVHCEVSADKPCTLQPCQNGGQCSDTGPGTSFSCACVDGWLGATCSIPPVDYCQPEQCGPFGVCIADASAGNNFTRCICTLGYSGTDCSTEPTVCAGKCLNGGLCVHEGTLTAGDSQNYACICPPPWVGQFCHWNETQWNSAPSTSVGLFSAVALAVFALLF